jgi:ribosomal-protein-alanine N-acetyltransferase
MIQLETARLRIRELDEADAPFLLEVLNEPAFLQNIGDRGVRTVTEAVRYMHERMISRYERDGFGMWRVELAHTAEPIGMCGLIKRDELEDVDLGFAFLERFWRRGFAFEAAAAAMAHGWNVVQLSRLVAIVAAHNTASIRLLEKLRFSYERDIRLMPEGPELSLFAIARPK